jgi:TolB-like protein
MLLSHAKTRETEMLRLSIFGRFRAADAFGKEIPIKSKKARALLAYLALPTGKERSREEVMALLWSERADEQARSSLRQALSGLRKELGETADRALKITDEWLALDPGLVAVQPASPDDVLLAGLHINDPAFDEWLRDERLRTEGVAAPVTPTPEPPLSNKPSIAVLPFVNMSGDPEQEYFSDGITEDITTELSRFESTFVLRDREEDMFDVLRELGAHYLVEGSIRKAGNRIRLTAQLVDSESRKHVWADRYDRELTDVFAIQDELVHAIVTTLAGRLETEGLERALRKPPENLAAYDYYLRGLRYDRLYDARVGIAGQEALEKAVALDPAFARAYGLLASFKMFVGWFEGTLDYASDEILDLAKKAVELDPTDGDCFAKLGIVHLDRNEHELARYNLETALSLNPHDSYTWAHYAWYLVTAGRPAEALEYLDRTLAVEPHPPNWNWDIRAEALYDLHRYEEAAEVLERKAVRYHYNYGQLAACYGQLGRREEAAANWAKVLEINPQTRLSSIGDGLGYQRQEHKDHWRGQEHKDHWRDGLLKVGLAD